MELESIEPSHRAFANGRYILENPVSLDTLVFAYRFLVESIKVMPVH
jgi:hypothetical protein